MLRPGRNVVKRHALPRFPVGDVTQDMRSDLSLFVQAGPALSISGKVDRSVFRSAGLLQAACGYSWLQLTCARAFNSGELTLIALGTPHSSPSSVLNSMWVILTPDLAYVLGDELLLQTVEFFYRTGLVTGTG